MSNPGHELTIDTEAIWAAIVRSKQLDAVLERISEEIAEEARALARQLAYDDGYLASSYRGYTADAGVVRRFANEYDSAAGSGAGVNRRRRGQRGKNAYLDYFQTEDPNVTPTSYKGRLGVVSTNARTAVWAEYGSIANNPKRILWTACERVAARYDLETVVLWNRFHTPNSAELSAKQRAGHAKRSGGTSESGGES